MVTKEDEMGNVSQKVTEIYENLAAAMESEGWEYCLTNWPDIWEELDGLDQELHDQIEKFVEAHQTTERLLEQRKLFDLGEDAS